MTKVKKDELDCYLKQVEPREIFSIKSLLDSRVFFMYFPLPYSKWNIAGLITRKERMMLATCLKSELMRVSLAIPKVIVRCNT